MVKVNANPRRIAVCPGRVSRNAGLALVLTVLLVAMLTVAAAQLAMLSSTESVSTARESRTLQHELAVDSVIAWLAESVREADSPIEVELDRQGTVLRRLDLGSCGIQVRVQDDGVKFDPSAFSGQDQQRLLESKLRKLMRAERLPNLALDLRPIVGSGRSPAVSGRSSSQPPTYLWFDQLFTPAGPHEIFHWSEEALESPPPEPVWSDSVTFFGDGRIDVRRASPAVLETMLDDFGSELAADIVAARTASTNSDVVQRALAGLGQSVRAQASKRLAYGLNRYALTIHTCIGSDVRRWYVVATCKDGQARMQHRSPITW